MISPSPLWHSASAGLSRMAAMALAVFILLSTAGAEDRTDPPADERENLLRHSLQIIIDVPLRDEMAAADADFKSGDVAAASERWLRLLETQQPEAVIADADGFLSAHAAIVRRLRSLSDEQRAIWLRIAEPRAAAALSRARSDGSLEGFARVRDSYPLTDSALEAMREGAGLAFDEGKFFECAAMLDRLSRENATGRRALPSKFDQLKLAISLHKLGRNDAAVSVWRQAPREAQAFSLAELQSLTQWQADLQFLDAASAEADRSSATDGFSTSEATPAAPEPSWQFQFVEPVSGKSVDSRLIHDFEKVAHPLLAMPNCDDDENGVFGGANSFVRLNHQGEKLWQFDRIPALDSAELARRSLGESVQAQITVLGGHVFGLSNWQLKAFDLDSGQIVWSTLRTAKDDGGREHTMFALGLPAALQNDLCYLVEVDDEIRFVVADLRTGDTQWSLKLGRSGLPRAFDPRRSWMPALIRWDGGRAICATGNGGLVAVDVLGRRIEWIRAVSREDWRAAGPPRASTPPMSPRIRLWSGWRKPSLELIGSHLVWASPEADSLIGLSPETGETIWDLSRGNALATTTRDSNLLVLEPDRVRRVQPANGENLWSVRVGPIAGTGVFHRGQYFVPIRNIGVASLRLTDGLSRCSITRQAIDGAGDANPDLQCLELQGRGIVVQRGDAFLTDPAIPRESEDRTDATKGDDSVENLIELAKQQAEKGDQSGARQAMHRAFEKSAEGDREEVLAAWGRLLLAQSVAPLKDDEAREIVEDLRHVGRATLDADLKLRMFAQCMQQMQDAESALEWMTAACEQKSREDWIALDDGRRVRADRFAISLLIADPASRELSPQSKAAVQEIHDRWIAGGDPEKATRLVELLSATDWGTKAWLASIESIQPDLNLHPSMTRASILMRLEALKAIDSTLAARIDAIRFRSAEIKPPLPPWPTLKPSVSVREWDWPIDVHPIAAWPIVADAGSMNVELNSGGQIIRFSGNGESRPWAVPLSLPGKLARSERSLQMYADHQRAWLAKDFAIIQAGSELYGIDPSPAGGIRSAELIWPRSQSARVDTLDDVSNMNVAFLPRLSEGGPGSRHEELDEFGRPLAQISPVRLNYFAIRQFNRLVACETATGEKLWERPGFGKHAVAYGDESIIAIVSPDSESVDVLRPLDGRRIGSWDRRFSVESVVGVVGRTAFIFPPGAEREIQAIDLADGRVQWRAVVDAAAIGFLIENRFVGVLEPGRLRFFDQATGVLAATREVATPPNCESVQVIADAFAVIVLASAAPDIEQSRPPLVYLSGYRRPWVNGAIFGLDPKTLEVRWTHSAAICVVPLDQPRDIPIWFSEVSEAGPEAEENLNRPSQVRGFDKRTGEAVFDFAPGTTGRAQMTIERDQSAGWIDFRASKKILRLNFDTEAAPR